MEQVKTIYFERLERRHQDPHRLNFKISGLNGNVVFNRWFIPYFKWIPYKSYNFDNELITHKDQSNPWPKTRLVEDPSWFYADQFDTWNFISGRDWLVEEKKIDNDRLERTLRENNIDQEFYQKHKNGYMPEGIRTRTLDEIPYPEWAWKLEKDRLIHEAEIREAFKDKIWYASTFNESNNNEIDKLKYNKIVDIHKNKKEKKVEKDIQTNSIPKIPSLDLALKKNVNKKKEILENVECELNRKIFNSPEIKMWNNSECVKYLKKKKFPQIAVEICDQKLDGRTLSSIHNWKPFMSQLNRTERARLIKVVNIFYSHNLNDL